MNYRKVILTISLIFVLNYLITFFLGYFLSYSLYDEISQKAYVYILSIVNTFNLFLVFIEWWLIRKYILKEQKEFYKIVNNKLYRNILVVLFPALAFAIYSLLTDRLISLDFENHIHEIINQILVYILLIPLIEEIIYREILFKLLIKAKTKIYWIGLVTSLLFTLIHINPLEFDLFYLLYIFIIGLVLFFVRLKNGLLASIITHSLVNSIMIIFYFIC